MITSFVNFLKYQIPLYPVQSISQGMFCVRCLPLQICYENGVTKLIQRRICTVVEVSHSNFYINRCVLTFQIRASNFHFKHLSSGVVLRICFHGCCWQTSKIVSEIPFKCPKIQIVSSPAQLAFQLSCGVQCVGRYVTLGHLGLKNWTWYEGYFATLDTKHALTTFSTNEKLSTIRFKYNCLCIRITQTFMYTSLFFEEFENLEEIHTDMNFM